MSTVFIIFCIFIFIVELAVIYSPLYYLSYCIFHIDRRIGDNKLFTILLLLSISLAILFLPTVLHLLGHIIVKS